MKIIENDSFLVVLYGLLEKESNKKHIKKEEFQ